MEIVPILESGPVTREEVASLAVFDLRSLGRLIGVQSPSSKTIDQMIDLILKVQSGELVPAPKSTRGRPAKQKANEDVIRCERRIKIELKKLYGDKYETFDLPDDNYVNSEVISCYSDMASNLAYEDTQKSQTNYEKLENSSPCENKETDATENTQTKESAVEACEGVLDIVTEGNYGFLRASNCEHGSRDTHVSNRLIRNFGLRKGDYIKGQATVNYDNKPPSLSFINTVNDKKPVNLRSRSSFDNLVPIYPDQKLRLEVNDARNDFAIRCIDLIAPIGKGQRAMIVSPPKAGKTTLLKKIANSITINNPEVKLFVLLVDERPEEVTDMQRSINGEIIYSTFDETPEHHCKVAELVIERAKRNVELGNDVVIIMDSLTRLARAYNLTIPPTGRTLSGGIDPGALHSPKRFFGAARNIENGGSLTIIATALVDTGSRMDDVIYEEFKGTGNMEIHLDRKLSEKRIFPAIDLNKSGTRREDLLLNPQELEGIWAIRKMLSGGDNQDSAEKLIDMIVKTRNNKEFIEQLKLSLKYLEKEGYNFRK